VAVLLPQTYMNEAGAAAGPARGELGLPLERVVALHDGRVVKDERNARHLVQAEAGQLSTETQGT